jgi:hypothetical protein
MAIDVQVHYFGFCEHNLNGLDLILYLSYHA